MSTNTEILERVFKKDEDVDLRRALDASNAIIAQQADEMKALQDRLDRVLEAVWSFTELDAEHTITCHSDSLPALYRLACAALDSAKSAGTPNLSVQP